MQKDISSLNKQLKYDVLSHSPQIIILEKYISSLRIQWRLICAIVRGCYRLMNDQWMFSNLIQAINMLTKNIYHEINK